MISSGGKKKSGTSKFSTAMRKKKGQKSNISLKKKKQHWKGQKKKHTQKKM